MSEFEEKNLNELTETVETDDLKAKINYKKESTHIIGDWYAII